MEIIKPGKLELKYKRRITCEECGCIFIYDRVSEATKVDYLQWVICPTCSAALDAKHSESLALALNAQEKTDYQKN